MDDVCANAAKVYRHYHGFSFTEECERFMLYKLAQTGGLSSSISIRYKDPAPTVPLSLPYETELVPHAPKAVHPPSAHRKQIRELLLPISEGTNRAYMHACTHESLLTKLHQQYCIAYTFTLHSLTHPLTHTVHTCHLTYHNPSTSLLLLTMRTKPST
jgi:hypothetical protein